MSRLNGFEYIEIDGKKVWVYGPPGHPEARAETPGKYGEGDWKGIMVAPGTCEVAPSMVASLLVDAAMIVAQRLWPADTVYNLDYAGYLDKLTSIETMEQGILVAHECHLAWQAHRKRHGRG